MALTGRTVLLALLGSLVVGLLLPSLTGVLVMAGVVVLGVLVDLLLAAPVRGLRLQRAGATQVRLGETADVSLLISNPSGRTLRGELRDAWPPSSWPEGTPPSVSRHTIEVPGQERRRVTTRLQPIRRGDRRAHRVTVRSVGPLGLAARQGSHVVPWSVRVTPPFTSRKHLPSRLARLRDLDGRASVMLRGQGTEFDSLREYVPGDDVRSIDWRATARGRTVAVRTWRPERDRHVLIVLDTGRVSAGRVGDAPRLDAAMDAALLLAALATRAGDRVDLLAHDRRTRASVQSGNAATALPAMVEALAGLEPELVESDPRSMVAAIRRRARRRSLVVLLTGLETAPVEEGLLPVLPALTSRHEVVVAAVSDPRVDEMAAARGTLHDIYEAAAAERTRAERRRVEAMLGRCGVTVVDRSPEELPPALADTYLALKAAGRL
ncbi:DUF58 domain-containing protein [Allostreptomyces psammosilenae]|uniref:Uncharacterized protein (DUF58 family) n=1 Tax=Allostreptomyces psammosilenae TaxID=1892865 RepID=A0A852ZWU7_9ACTN|nr:DUF58 domain-containing protein [Allostreptomyces psammosilenae]NYI06167.1 uncharacterized protein (DUF58 family) [Allostreptomyces psammosilenae]